MKKVASALFVIGIVTLSFTHVFGQCTAIPTPPNGVNTLIIDTRPNEINKFSGRTKFKNEARIALINMNPFLYTYDVQVQQTEIKDTALLDFFKLLGSPLSDIFDITSVDRKLRLRDVKPITGGGSLVKLLTLTGPVPPSPAPSPAPTPPNGPSPLASASCTNTSVAQDALNYLAMIRWEMLLKRNEIELTIFGNDAMGKKVAGHTGLADKYADARIAYQAQAGTIFDPSVETSILCGAVGAMHATLRPSVSNYPSKGDLAQLKEDIEVLSKLIEELKNSVEAYRKDSTLQNCSARLKGYSYVDSLGRLANEMDKVRKAYDEQADTMIDETQKYNFMIAAIEKLSGNEDLLLQRVINVRRQYDISAFDVEVTPVEVRRRDATARTVAADPLRSSERASVATDAEPAFPFTNRETSHGSVEADDTGAIRSSSRFRSRDDAPAADNAPRKTVASGTIGNRRFEISGGLVYSSLPRREFQPVLGFARDEQGNLVDEDGNVTDKRSLTSIVGISEDSNRRLAPMALLHTRITNFRKYNLFMSFGVTGKRDNAGTDIEYLFGPSVNLFGNRVFLTFGGYAGRQQKLAGDLFLNARLPDGTDTIPIRKEFQWKPGFAFTYRFPLKSGSEESK